MVGSVSGPAIGMSLGLLTRSKGRLTTTGPCVGGIIVTFAQWRIIYWLQFGMTLLGLTLSVLFVPTIRNKKQKRTQQLRKSATILTMFNPLRILRPLIYPNVFLCVSTASQNQFKPNESSTSLADS